MEITIKKPRNGSLVEHLENKIEKRVSEQLAIPKSSNWSIRLWLAILVLLFLTCGNALRGIDPMAAIMDLGVLMVLLLALIAVVLAHTWAIWASKALLKELMSTAKTQFGETFKNLTVWQIIICFGASYVLLFSSFLWGFSKCL